ncbi:MAG: hypothetical protein MW690_000941 [Methanophagales archaeon]|nr:hypothetical protein [Methanophagales archaeon]
MHGCEFHEKPRRKCWVAAETSQNPQNSTKTATLFRRPHHLLMYLHIQLHIISFSVSAVGGGAVAKEGVQPEEESRCAPGRRGGWHPERATRGGPSVRKAAALRSHSGPEEPREAAAEAGGGGAYLPVKMETTSPSQSLCSRPTL